jgi:hypothetical protein
MSWKQLSSIGSKEYTCGFCSRFVASNLGYYHNHPNRKVYVCPNCDSPTYFISSTQIPGIAPGHHVGHLPKDLEMLYTEARQSSAANSYTGSVLICRKLLMNLAVSQGAQEGQKFIEYVDFLASKGYVPPNGRSWVDHIRQKGNEANHEISLMSKDDAEELISFSEMLLKFIYEFPAKVPKKTEQKN